MSRGWPTKLLFALTMTFSGFLVFQVQPIIAKFILPWFGGSATTWSVCLLFFQVALLFGYGYVHALTVPLKPRTQVILHAALLCVAIYMLPITPSDIYKPVNADDPIGRILALLTMSVGFPYVVLSTTSPLLQRWLAVLDKDLLASRFFAVSNCGSFVGLLTYPFWFEQQLSSVDQTIWWSRAFLAFAVTMAPCMFVLLRSGRAPSEVAPAVETGVAGATGDCFPAWTGYAMLGSVLLLATTNELTQWTAVLPFLWILPLSLYLATFIIAFGHQNLYDRRTFAVLFATAFAITFLLPPTDPEEIFLPTLLFPLVTMTLGCLICHSEMVRLQPPAPRLPRFYLATALGGALGGVLVTLVAPAIFSDYWEFPLALTCVGCIALALEWRHLDRPAGRLWPAIATCVFCIGMAGIVYRVRITESTLVDRTRNFYGVIKVVRDPEDDPQRATLSMVQAGSPQGSQYLAPERRAEPYCAYLPGAGVGRAFSALRAQAAEQGRKGLRIGVVGLGVGVTSALTRADDTLVIYELNPAVTEFARKHFTFLADSPTPIQVQHGDGRILLERALQAGHPGDYDLLIIDAFRGASPPLHLMTREAFDIYRRHLRPDGILAVNFEISILDIDPLHRGLAASTGMDVGWFETPDTGDECDDSISWALYAPDARLLRRPEIAPGLSPWRDGRSDQLVWTDASANLLSIVNWQSLLGRLAGESD